MSRRTSKKTQSLRQRSAAPQRPVQQKWDPELVPCMEFLKKKLKTKEAIQYGRRVDCFTGSKLISFLMKRKHSSLPNFKSREDVESFCQKLNRAGFFFRSDQAKSRKRRLELVNAHNPVYFSSDGIFTWVYEGSMMRTYLMCFGIVFGMLAVCVMKVWPLWLKVIVYWVSLVLLVTQLSLIVLRSVIYAFCWILGFREYWLFPNLFNDDLYVSETLTPLFGKGIQVKELTAEEQLSQEYFDDDTDPVSASSKSQKTETIAEEDFEEEKSYKFGIINCLIIFVLGCYGCYQIGLFDSDNIPDFVASRDDLYLQFPGLMPPTNETVNMTEAHTGTGMPEVDPEDGGEEAEFDINDEIKDVHLDHYEAEATEDLDDVSEEAAPDTSE